MAAPVQQTVSSPRGTSARPLAWWEKVTGIFFAPGATAADLVVRPEFWGPVLFFLVAAVAAVPAGQKVTAVIMARMGRPVPTGVGALVGPAVGGFISNLLAWPLRAVVFYGIGLLFTPAITYRQALSVAGYLVGIQALGACFVALVYAATSVVLSPGLAAGLTVGERLAFPGSLLAELNLFTVWYLVTSTVVLAKLYRIGRVKAAVVTVILWALVLGARLALLSWQMGSLPA